MQSTALIAAATAFPIGALPLLGQEAPVATFDPESLKNLDGVTAETFEKWTGGQFRVSLNGQNLGTMVLVKVRDLSKDPLNEPSNQPPAASGASSNTGAKVYSFMLVFERGGSQLPQETYTVNHDRLGTFPLLLVPSGAKRYTASFSSLEASSAN